MRLLVLSDIHSNHTALRKVLDDAGDWDRALCAGDLVGYGPDPNGCLATVRSEGIMCIKGNHDDATVTGETTWFNQVAARAIEITRGIITRSNRSYLQKLPTSLHLELGGVKIVSYHGSPENPLREYVYPGMARLRAEGFMQRTGADLLVLGHTHVPYIIRDHRVIMNPGSVGQPRDGDPRASYMLVETDEMKVEHRRIEYDVDSVASRIRSMGLPGILADRLYVGR